jgi:hypothetical protein
VGGRVEDTGSCFLALTAREDSDKHRELWLPKSPSGEVKVQGSGAQSRPAGPGCAVRTACLAGRG